MPLLLSTMTNDDNLQKETRSSQQHQHFQHSAGEMKRLCRVGIVLTVIVVVLSLTVLLAKGEISSGSESNLSGSPENGALTLNTSSHASNITNEGPRVAQSNVGTLDTVETNRSLASRVAYLENRLQMVEQVVISLSQDIHFQHPTMEVQYVDMQVVQWEQAVKKGLGDAAIAFNAGYSIGAISSWEFSLASENDALTVNLRLIEESYNKGALFAGFTTFVLNHAGNVYSQANALPVNFLDGSGRTLHLPNVVTFAEIRNATNGLSESDVFKIRFRLEMLGVGHKLYPEMALPREPLAKDVQTVVFDVDDIMTKVKAKNSSTNATRENKPLAYTWFTLRHDSWHLNTQWTAELHDEDGKGSISLHVILEECEWPQLYASCRVEVWDLEEKNMILSQDTPINNYVRDRITIDPLITAAQLKDLYEDGEKPIFQFKLQFVVYGKNARYYKDVI